MNFISAGDLNERVQARELTYDKTEDGWSWQRVWGAWVKAVQSDRASYFSTVGIGARSVAFNMRKASRINLGLSFLWRGQFCFLTSITDVEQPGMVEVKAALCETVECRKDWDKSHEGTRFPGVLTEKYVGHEQLDPHAMSVTTYVLVTPKAIELAAGSLVQVVATPYKVLTVHTLDQWKNEYEIVRKADL